MNEYYQLTDFGELLRKLIYYSEQKNYTLALHLGYDVSYVSKWVTKSMLPANKNIQRICESTADFIVNSTSDLQKYELWRFYKIPEKEINDKTLYQTIRESLTACYQYSTQANKNAQIPDQLLPNAHFSVNPRLQRAYLNNVMPIAAGSQDFIMFANLFTMGKEDKLSIAGFDNSFDLEQKNPCIRIMLSLTQYEQDLVFNSILLIYMIANYAEIDFELYMADTVPCSLMLAIRDFFCHTSILIENHRCIVSQICTDKKLVNELYDTMEDVIKTQSKHVFKFISMQEMIHNHYYAQAIISPNIHWLIGSMTEQFLPNDLFDELLIQYIDDPTYQEELKRNHMIMQNATCVSKIQILIFESTISKFILDGKLDFFTYPIVLDIHQRERHLRYMKELFCNTGYLNVRLVDGDFVEDFKAYDNPSIYLSDNLSYLRIENTSRNAIYMIKNKDLISVFSRFYEEIWDNRFDIVVKDRDVIEKKFDYHISCFRLFYTE